MELISSEGYPDGGRYRGTRRGRLTFTWGWGVESPWNQKWFNKRSGENSYIRFQWETKTTRMLISSWGWKWGPHQRFHLDNHWLHRTWRRGNAEGTFGKTTWTDCVRTPAYRFTEWLEIQNENFSSTHADSCLFAHMCGYFIQRISLNILMFENSLSNIHH